MNFLLYYISALFECKILTTPKSDMTQKQAYTMQFFNAYGKKYFDNAKNQKLRKYRMRQIVWIVAAGNRA